MTSAGKDVSHDGLITTVCNEDLVNGEPNLKCPTAAKLSE